MLGMYTQFATLRTQGSVVPCGSSIGRFEETDIVVADYRKFLELWDHS